jgi:hypothetical protein
MLHIIDTMHELCNRALETGGATGIELQLHGGAIIVIVSVANQFQALPSP